MRARLRSRLAGPFRRPGRLAPLLGAALGGLLALLALVVYLAALAGPEPIASGVTVGGVSVGGLSPAAAQGRLRADLDRTRTRWITLRYGSRRFVLTTAQAGLHADVAGAVRQAERLRGLLAASLGMQVPMRISYSHQAVDELIARVRGAVERPPRDAAVVVRAGGGLGVVPSRPGIAVETGPLTRELDRALAAPLAPHLVRVPVRALTPKVTTTAQLAARYPTYLVVDRPDFRLLVYRHLRLARVYPIAVGRQGLETPSGLHRVLDKQVNPAWHVPDSPWAGRLAGRVIPPGPDDPLVARWMAIDDQGDGIHGTDEPWSIGSAASHGCIRMLVPDVIALYRLTPLGTPVYVL